MLISLLDKVPFMEHVVKCVCSKSHLFKQCLIYQGYYCYSDFLSILFVNFFSFYFLSIQCDFDRVVSLVSSFSECSHSMGQEFPWPLFLAYTSLLRTVTMTLLNIPMRKNNIHVPFHWNKTDTAYCCVDSLASQRVDLDHLNC